MKGGWGWKTEKERARKGLFLCVASHQCFMCGYLIDRDLIIYLTRGKEGEDERWGVFATGRQAGRKGQESEGRSKRGSECVDSPEKPQEPIRIYSGVSETNGLRRPLHAVLPLKENTPQMTYLGVLRWAGELNSV